ncbi:MAG: alpha/beta hydrolase, partial [Chloroflexota bacterium]|nr:alpha/beta hydrolase [Chloroflexota bacterium]
MPFELGLYPELRQRDVVVIDPRGVGVSRPRITCFELISLAGETVGEPVTFDQQRADVIGATQRCRQRMTAHQLDPSAYHSAAMADDLEDLRKVLGYPALNVYGVSYGTRIALEYARRYPAQTRSLVLDGVVPPDADLYADWAPNFWSALDALFAACESDKRCRRSHRNIRDIFLQQVAELNESPIAFDLTFGDDAYTVAVDGEDLVFLAFLSMYDSSRFLQLPYELEQLAGREPALIENSGLLGAYREYTAEAHYLSVMCSEYAPFTSADEVAESARDLDPRIGDPFLDATQTALDQCAVWNVPPRTAEFAPVDSDVPTLLLSGEFDPVTPPAYAERVAANLPNSTHVVVPATGHGTLIGFNACPARVVASFLDEPLSEPNT